MLKQSLIFISIQITGLIISFFLLAAALVGSHGSLSFSGDGIIVAAIITIILTTPLLYLVFQRRTLRYKKFLFTVAIFVFALSMSALYIGIPVIIKQFLAGKRVIKDYAVFSNNDLEFQITLKPEMFERVFIEANISKSSGVDIKQLNLTILNNKNEVVQPVFQPLAWNNSHSKTIEMNNFFEINEYTNMNRFLITAQYSIVNTSLLSLQANCLYSKEGQEYSMKKEISVDITNHLTRENLIYY